MANLGHAYSNITNKIISKIGQNLTTPIPSKAKMAVPKKKGYLRHVEENCSCLGSLKSYRKKKDERPEIVLPYKLHYNINTVFKSTM